MTERVRVSLGGGTWFDPSAADQWNSTKLLGAGFYDQRLYRTCKGAWILHSWSKTMSAGGTYEPIAASAAHAWLLEHGHVDAIPSDALRDGEV